MEACRLKSWSQKWIEERKEKSNFAEEWKLEILLVEY